MTEPEKGRVMNTEQAKAVVLALNDAMASGVEADGMAAARECGARRFRAMHARPGDAVEPCNVCGLPFLAPSTFTHTGPFCACVEDLRDDEPC